MSQYWKNRAEQRMSNDIRRTKKFTEKIKLEYIRAYNDINRELKAIYGDIKDPDRITMQDLNKNINSSDMLALKLDLYKLLQSADRFEKDQGITMQLARLGNKNKITRLESLQVNIMANMYSLAKAQEKGAKNLLKEVYKEDYASVIYDFYKENADEVLKRLDKGLIGIQNKDIAEVLQHKWSGSNYSEDIWDRELNIGKKIQKKMINHMQRGTSVKDLSKELKKELQIDSTKNIERLIQTETSFINNQATLRAYEDMDLREYQIHATLDNRTSSICQEQDGKIYKIEDAAVGVNYPPFHPWCRTTTISVNKYNIKGTRAARVGDRKVKVDRNMKYNDFKEIYLTDK